MASTLAAPKSYNVPHFIGKNYEIALNQSIEAILTSLEDLKSINSPTFISDFQELIQSKADPPLETIWVFAALTFNNPSTPKIEPLDRTLAIKDLFQLIVSCSASCHSVKSIVLVAPVIYILHDFILDLNGLQLASKKEGKVKKDIKNLVDSVIGYINICCDGFDGNFDDLEDLIRPLGELVNVWIVDNGVQNKSLEAFRMFFPFLTDDTVTRLSVEGCEMVELAGFVVAEAFLLKVCWKIQEEGFGERMQNELRSWIVGSITGLRNSYFYATLASMLLEPVLPTAFIMNLEHEDGLRKILFDALVLVEYSFLTPASLDGLPAKHAKCVNFTKLLVTDEAIALLRKRGDQIKSISYLNAFTNSSLPSQIIKWVRNEIGEEHGNSKPNGSSPRAFLKWMLNVENRGVKIFDDEMSKYRAKLISYNMEEGAEQLGNGQEGMKPDSDLFYVDNKGQEEYGNDEDEKTNKSMSDAFMAAAHSMESSEHGGRKRKTKNGTTAMKVKYQKYSLLDNSVSGERSEVPRNGDSNSGSDVENPDSDEDMEVRE